MRWYSTHIVTAANLCSHKWNADSAISITSMHKYTAVNDRTRAY